MAETPLTLSPLSRFRIDVAVAQRRIRRADYLHTMVALTLTDGTMLKLASEAEVLIAVRCLTSAAHAGMSPADARAAERAAALASQEKEKAHR